MTIQILFVQGGGESVHDQWDDKLVASLAGGLGPDFEIRYPRMPDEANPSYRTWKAALEEELARLDAGAIIVGHSVGATILINALAQGLPKRALRAIMLIAAPFIGPGGWPSDEITPVEFANRLPGDVPVFLYRGTEDAVVPVAHLDLYARAIPGAIVRRLAGRDHQLDNNLAEIAEDIRALA